MSPRIIDCEQSSPEWYAARLGLPTASMFATVMAKGKDGGASATRKTYMHKLAGEILTGDMMEGFTNDHMQRGKDMEAEARQTYAFIHGAKPQQVGFVVNGRKGASPDSLLGDSGMLEIKTKLPHLMIDCILKDEFPVEHKAQCQGALWVAEREWIDIAVYWPKMPLFVKRAYRDADYIQKLSDAVDKFNEELDEVVDRIRRYGEPMEQAA
jgi:hypothetical protein